MNKGKRMIFEDEYKYLQELKSAHSDPSAEWGGSGSEYSAGEGITIESNVISANLKAGYGIVVDDDLSDNSKVIMIDDSDIQDKLTAGSGIDIDGTTNTISVDSTVAFKTDIETYTEGSGIVIDASNIVSVDSTIALVSDLSVYQLISNMVSAIDSSSTDTQYPTAKCVYDIVGNIESLLSAI